MHCSRCHHNLVGDLPGREPVGLEIYDGETIIVCRNCADMLMAEMKRKKTEEEKMRVVSLFLIKASMAVVLFLLLTSLTP